MLPVRRKVPLPGLDRRVGPSSGYWVNVAGTRPWWGRPTVVTAAVSTLPSMGCLAAIQKKQHAAPYCA